MGILNIQEAEREGARLVVSLSAVSGEGKTHTALLLAWGLANYDSRKVGLLDTENKRGRLYSDILRDENGKVHRFMHAEFDPPFSPKRYKEAILEWQAAGIEVLVIDSVSHEWEGTGGCDEIAASTNAKMPDWKLAKAQHKSFMNTLLQCNMHVICCVRAREKTDFTNPRDPVRLGIQPIQEKNFMFEMTASLMMHDRGRRQAVLKCPAELLPILGREQGYLGASDGKALRDWVDGAKALNPATEAARNLLRTTTEQGMAALQAAWIAQPVAVRQAISPDGRCPADLKASAMEFDRLRAEARGASPDLDDMNSAIAGVDADGVIQGEAA